MTHYTGHINSTYRLQFHKDFTLKDLEQVQDYLEQLGIGAVYASPVFSAVPGSMHGYDVLDPGQVNPELGTKEQLKAVALQLKRRGIGWLQDIVPNHMGFHPGNPWLLDLLEKGHRSMYASFFDTSLYSHFFSGRIMVPFLGASLEDVIKNGELQISYSGERLVFTYYDQEWPLHPLSYVDIFQSCPGGSKEDFRQLTEEVVRIQKLTDPHAYALQWDEFRLRLKALSETRDLETHLDNCLRELNSRPEQLRVTADQQAYRLCSWQETDTSINYRRFFTINSLICLNMQENEVFRKYHSLVATLLKEGIFGGLRVDHVDGLFDPAGYLEQLRELAGEKTYLVVEKILEDGEELPAKWPVQGTSGYDFLAQVNNLFTWSDSKEAFSRFYRQLTGDQRSVQEQIREKKASILQQHMKGELDNLYALFRVLLKPEDITGPGKVEDPGTLTAPGEPPAEESARPEQEQGKGARAVSEQELKQAVGAFLVHCPVYRYYGNRFPLDEREAEAVRNVFEDARTHQPALAPALSLLEDVLLYRTLEDDRTYNDRALLFYQRCMQFSGPLMAKGVEDTLMYTYNRFIGHNEVGDSPEAFGLSAEAFHDAMLTRVKNWPHSLNATATHDTKRGEDVRARLNVLTCLPREWTKAVRQWQKMNSELKQQDAPDANDEYFIYQTLAGAWPLQEQDEDEFGTRLNEYMVKALREAKRHSNWSDPNEEYEHAVTNFVDALLDKARPFRQNFVEFVDKIRDPGRINSLAQLLLKLTCPGVPDIYQGCELWDLSLVDPDNRRPVDYNQRQQWLSGFDSSAKEPQELLRELWQDTATPRIKLWLTNTLLAERRQQPLPFSRGHYIPLTVKGPYREQLLAFARRHGATWYVTVVPLHLAVLCRRQNRDVASIDWKDTRILLPPEAPAEWEHLLDGTTGRREQYIHVKDIFSVLPLALLRLKSPVRERSAGVLMHVTSLPSPFGTGDLGESAREFARFLSRSGQQYWQLLPLNPVAQEEMYSPYSPVSSMAGNPLLLSPEHLAAEGWLHREELLRLSLPDNHEMSVSNAFGIRELLLEKAWENFRATRTPVNEGPFRQFCTEEAAWLHDFALYMLLKKQHANQPWNRWPEKYRLRDKAALEELAAAQENALDKEKWFQFLFSRQWKALREYCASLGIRMFGDLPFYISYDSADVWSNRDIFSVDEEGRMTTVAGVPPDYFNNNGQLWGMPVFRWEVLKAQGYDWWVRRIRRNMEWFDLLRLDHFRAFSAYWEVPAEETTAINGQWKPGPGGDLFDALHRELGTVPFVAEDLGDIDEKVYRLRDEFGLPGMKVLQFAFGDDVGGSPHIPHQYTPEFIVYTGTHDNNTTRGWYSKELDSKGRRQLREYTASPVAAKNVHKVLSRMAYASVAGTVILPVQDILGLDERARMNVPASIKGNWQWRLLPGLLTPRIERQLLQWVKLYGRG